MNELRMYLTIRNRRIGMEKGGYTRITATVPHNPTKIKKPSLYSCKYELTYSNIAIIPITKTNAKRQGKGPLKKYPIGHLSMLFEG